MNSFFYRMLGAALALGVAQGAWATTISYTVGNVGGTTWQYNYTVANDTLAVPIQEFTIFFSDPNYGAISSPAQPAGWSPLVVNSGLASFFDELAAPASAIPVGGSQGGFAVQVDWFGIGSVPGAQSFDIVDPSTFQTIDSGTTVLAIPEPGMLLLLAGGLIGLAGIQSRKGRSPRC